MDAVDLRDGRQPVDVRLSGDGHQAVAEVLQDIRLRESDDVRQESFSIGEARSQKGPYVLLQVFAMSQRADYSHITHSLVVSWHVYKCHPVGIPGFHSQ